MLYQLSQVLTILESTVQILPREPMTDSRLSSQEQEVLYETEGENRSAALNRTTIGVTIVESALPGAPPSPPGFDWDIDDAPPPDYLS